jgi:hypothetical protein
MCDEFCDSTPLKRNTDQLRSSHRTAVITLNCKLYKAMKK